MKKKILAISLVVAMLAIAIVGGSLAWFTDTDEATNTFTVGSIKVVQNEWDAYGSPFVQDQTMLPIVNIDDPAADPNYIDKVVTVSNTGKNDAYVRTFIAVDNRIAPYLHLDLNVADGWTRDADQTAIIDGQNHKVLVFTYTNKLVKGATTPALLKGVYLSEKLDVKVNPSSNNMEFCIPDGNGGYNFSGFAVQDAEGTTYKVNVLVATQAVQADGFANAKTALDSAFGEASHPSFS